MLQNGKLAAATLPEPMGSVAIANGCKLVTDSEALGINPGVMMFTAKSVDSKKKELQAFYRAYNKAVAYLNEHPMSDYIDIMIEKNSFPAEVKTALQLPKYRVAGLPSQKDVDTCLQWMLKKELVKTSFSYDEIVVDINK